MSLESTLFAWRTKGISPAAKLVLLWISEAVNEDWFFCFNMKALHEFTGCDPDQINQLICELKKAGLIKNAYTNSIGQSVYQLIVGVQP